MRRLKNRYRLVILKDNDLAEKASFFITGLNVLAFLSIVLVMTFVLFWALFSYTPLVYFLPVSEQLSKERELNRLARTTDSLTQVIEDRQSYFNNIKTILKGGVPDTNRKAITPVDKELKSRKAPFRTEKALNPDTLPKLSMPNSKPSDNLLTNQTNQVSTVSPEQISFFPPLEGLVTAEYQDASDHFAVDVVAPANSRINAVKDGHVIYTGWSASTGHVIMIQHDFNLISVYKHSSELLKNVGSFVQSGESIAVVGTSGNLSTGPHLHFELWKNGAPLDPQAYINFE